jgi:hypothetical protein
MDPEAQDLASTRELLFHVNNVFHDRVNLLLLAQSIFFAAIATLWQDQGRLIKLVICGLGIVMTLVLWYANFTLYKRSNVLTVRLQVDPVYKAYLDAVSLKYVTVTGLFAHVLPFACLSAWTIVALRILRVI